MSKSSTKPVFGQCPDQFVNGAFLDWWLRGRDLELDLDFGRLSLTTQPTTVLQMLQDLTWFSFRISEVYSEVLSLNTFPISDLTMSKSDFRLTPFSSYLMFLYLWRKQAKETMLHVKILRKKVNVDTSWQKKVYIYIISITVIYISKCSVRKYINKDRTDRPAGLLHVSDTQKKGEIFS